MSLGKWALGLRVHHAASGVPVWHRTMLRSAVFMIPSELPYLYWSHEDQAVGFAAIALQMLLLVPGRRSNGWMYFHEWVSGTRTKQTTLPFPRFTKHLREVERQSGPVSTEAEILGLYRLESHIATTSHGELYGAEDALLTRRVWILAAQHPLLFGTETSHSHLHWLGSFEALGKQCQVLEAPGGDTLVNWRAAQGELAWEVLLRLLLELAEALSSAEASDYLLGQLWVDRNGRLKLLPFAIQEGEARRMNAVQLIGQAARILIGDEQVLPRDMPGCGDDVLQRILGVKHGYADVASVSAALAPMTQGPLAVTRRQRGFQALLTSMGIGSVTIVLMVTLAMTNDQALQLPDPDRDRIVAALAITGLICAVCVPFSALTRGGLLFRVFGMMLRTRRGKPAGALLYGLRTMLFLLPAICMLGIWATLASVSTLTAALTTLGIYGTALAGSIVWPHATLVDRLLGTRIVPRG
jgi:hypothetical protein